MSSTGVKGGDCRVCAAIRACKGAGLAVGAFSFAENLLMLAAPLYMMQVYDRVLASRSGETLVYLTLITAFALLALGVIDLARGRLLNGVATWLEQRLAPGLFERAVQSRLRGSNYGPEAMSDLSAVRSFVTSPGMVALFDLPWSAIFIAVAFMLHPWFGYLAVGACILLLGLGVLGEVFTRKPIQTAAEAGMLLRRQVDAMSRNAEVIEAMGMMPAVTRRWGLFNAQAQTMNRTISDRLTLLASTTKFIRLLLQSTGLALGAYLVIGQQTTGGAMIASSILLARAFGPVEQMVGAWRGLMGVRGSVQRLKAFALQPEYRPEAMRLPRPEGRLSVEGLVYRLSAYETPILKGISFELEPGETLAVIGGSGAGKSTLARLLVGSVPAATGLVRLDGADVFSWSRADIGQYLGYLPQDVELFAGTVSENIARLSEIVPEKIVAAAKLADVHELILRLPGGYETDIGDGGRHLSGGQRQRIALARAVYDQPRLVVLDEPNSNLDGDGEQALLGALTALKAAGSTVVVVTHRPALVQHADKVLLLRDGQIETFGLRQEVFAQLTRPAHAPPGHPLAAAARRA